MMRVRNADRRGKGLAAAFFAAATGLASLGLLQRAQAMVGHAPPALVGYGVTVRGDGRTGGTARAASLVVTGQPGSLQSDCSIRSAKD
jgi:hypothetical protein